MKRLKMETTKTFLQKELTGKDLYSEDIVRGYKMWTVVHTETGGYSENELNIYFHEDGSIFLSEEGGDGSISLSPKQLEYFKKLLIQN